MIRYVSRDSLGGGHGDNAARGTGERVDGRVAGHCLCYVGGVESVWGVRGEAGVAASAGRHGHEDDECITCAQTPATQGVGAKRAPDRGGGAEGGAGGGRLVWRHQPASRGFDSRPWTATTADPPALMVIDSDAPGIPRAPHALPPMDAAASGREPSMSAGDGPLIRSPLT